MVTTKPQLLVKARPMPKGSAFGIGAVKFEMEPLFPVSAATKAMGAAAPAEWHIATAPEGLDEADVWDLCHRLLSQGFGLAGGPEVEFAEPDFEQRWDFDSPDRFAAKGFAAAGNACERPDPPDARYPSPTPYEWNWYLQDAYSGLASARQAVGSTANRVSIAHLDTGYREGHAVLPTNLDLRAARSFVDSDPNPNSAVDPGSGGLARNPGHGTGTLSILAGSQFSGTPTDLVGGAPFARIVPVRVAESVVLFRNSAIARGIDYAITAGVDVLSMSMGGVPSQAWADVINRAYESGLVLVTAAGNNFGPGKMRVPRFIVWPARFRRVLAACGVMSDGRPYADFADARMMGGSYGPDSKMDTAMAAYTPNGAWADYNCPSLIDFDGSGTSSATPQIAAAAACWLQKHQTAVQKYSEKWMRVEAVRKALFESAAAGDREHLGKGTLRAAEALKRSPALENALTKLAPDHVGVPILGPIWGALFGLKAPSTAQRMVEIEAAQVLARSGELQRILIEAGVDPDQPAKDVPDTVRRRLAEAMAEDPSASGALKKALGAANERTVVGVNPEAVNPLAPVAAENPEIPAPATRRLRVFALDPALGQRLETERLNETTLEVPWEKDLQPGPVGEYLEVVDVDPSSDACYAPVDLNHPHLLASDGHAPSEGVPQFHQQMVYAVAMTTIGRFEHALGRTALWAPRIVRKNQDVKSYHVQRLRIYPHALREANAFYSPPRNALLFGYFRANTLNAGDSLPGGTVFTCLSHDVVAHETTHALVDGLHRYYRIQSNDDIAAFHEAFADIVALFQHFSMPAALRHVIAEKRGDLAKSNALARLAQQFGQATKGSQALRSALTEEVTVNDYVNATEAHARGAVLLGAVFQAFLEIYTARVADLKRLATGGTGVLPRGAISVDLVERMAQEAAAVAANVLTTCIRALDYCPPVDLTFGEYLRALITAEFDADREDILNYRTAFISGFRARGIRPSGVRNFSEESLRWQAPRVAVPREQIRGMLDKLDLTWNLSTGRRAAQEIGESNGEKLWSWLRNLTPEEGLYLGRDLGVYLTAESVSSDQARLKNLSIPMTKDGYPLVEIHSVRPARRVNHRGQQSTDLVVEAVQRCVYTDPETKIKSTHRGGCTILIDVENARIRYAIRKRVGSASRIEGELRRSMGLDEDSQAYFDTSKNREPFAMLHRGA